MTLVRTTFKIGDEVYVLREPASFLMKLRDIMGTFSEEDRQQVTAKFVNRCEVMNDVMMRHIAPDDAARLRELMAAGEVAIGSIIVATTTAACEALGGTSPW
jgi:hypothetical protein